MNGVCEHGSLKRSCEICERDSEIAALRERPSLAEQHGNRCVHFNGIQNKKCDANINYPPDCRNLPCHKKSGLVCPKQHFPTENEIKQFVEETEQRLNEMAKAFIIVGKIKKEHKGENWKGIEVCPVCGGKLHLSHSSFNGHVWGKCETEKCLGWME